jgi:hypothetical protein
MNGVTIAEMLKNCASEGDFSVRITYIPMTRKPFAAVAFSPSSGDIIGKPETSISPEVAIRRVLERSLKHRRNR